MDRDAHPRPQASTLYFADITNGLVKQVLAEADEKFLDEDYDITLMAMRSCGRAGAMGIRISTNTVTTSMHR